MSYTQLTHKVVTRHGIDSFKNRQECKTTPGVVLERTSMVRRTQRGADGHKQGSQSDRHAGLLRVDDVVGGRVAIGGDRLLVEKVTWWPALGCTQNAYANLSYILFLPHINGPCRLGYGSARHAAELVAGSGKAS